MEGTAKPVPPALGLTSKCATSASGAPHPLLSRGRDGATLNEISSVLAGNCAASSTHLARTTRTALQVQSACFAGLTYTPRPFAGLSDPVDRPGAIAPSPSSEPPMRSIGLPRIQVTMTTPISSASSARAAAGSPCSMESQASNFSIFRTFCKPRS